MTQDNKDALKGFFFLVLVAIFLFLVAQSIYTKLTKEPEPGAIQETIISENTILYTVGLPNSTCYITEAKTNGYIDIEIDCK